MLSKEDILIAGAVRRLFKNRFLLRRKSEQWFQVLVDQQEQVRDVLVKMGAGLNLDIVWGIAYITPLSEECEESIGYQLGATKTLSRYASLLLFFLRLKRLAFYRNPADEDAPVISREDLKTFLQEFNRHAESTRFEREFNKAIQDLLELDVLLKWGQDDIFEISPVCDIVLPADEIESYRKRFEDFFAQESVNDEVLLQADN